jgi:hypothetical protein
MAEIVRGNKELKPQSKKLQPKKAKQKPIKKSAKQVTVSSARTRRKKKRYTYERPERPAPLPSYMVRTSHLDRERVPEAKLEHCPHGVPHSKICAICDPQKFREMTGID